MPTVCQVLSRQYDECFSEGAAERCLLSQHLTGSEVHTVCTHVHACTRLVMSTLQPHGPNSPPGFSGHGISQSRVLFSSVQSLSRVWLWGYCSVQLSRSVVSDSEDTVQFSSVQSLSDVRLWGYCESEVKSLSRVRLFATPWTVAYQAPRSMGFSRQEYWSRVPNEKWES